LLDGVEDAAHGAINQGGEDIALVCEVLVQVPRAIRAGAQMAAMDVSWKPLRANTASAQSRI
jgi:hypothetical protein